MSSINPVCPTGCASILPDVSFDLCNPNVSWGEIQRIFVGMADATPFAGGAWTDLSLWTAALALATNQTDAIRQLYVSADLPAATADETVISLGRKIYSPATHVINVDVYDRRLYVWWTGWYFGYLHNASCNRKRHKIIKQIIRYYYMGRSILARTCCFRLRFLILYDYGNRFW